MKPEPEGDNSHPQPPSTRFLQKRLAQLVVNSVVISPTLLLSHLPGLPWKPLTFSRVRAWLARVATTAKTISRPCILGAMIAELSIMACKIGCDQAIVPIIHRPEKMQFLRGGLYLLQKLSFLKRPISKASLFTTYHLIWLLFPEVMAFG